MEKFLLYPLLILIAVAGAFAQQSNAALLYLRADVSLRQSFDLPRDGWNKLESELEKPLDSSVEEMLTKSQNALREFAHARDSKSCDWQISAQDGPLAATEHRGAVREVAALALLRARVRFQRGERMSALNDALGAYKSARDLSTDGSIASVLISYIVERESRSVLADHLSSLDEKERTELESQLTVLPKGSKMQEAIKAEKLERNDLVQILKGATSHDDLIKRLVAGVPALNGSSEVARAVIDGCGGLPSGVDACLERQIAFYKKWIALFGTNPSTFESGFKQDFLIEARTNPLLDRFTPDLSRLRWAAARNDVQTELLRAAIALRARGVSALSSHPDPLTGQPFHCKKIGKGYTLESAPLDDDKPITLFVQATQVP